MSNEIDQAVLDVKNGLADVVKILSAETHSRRELKAAWSKVAQAHDDRTFLRWRQAMGKLVFGIPGEQGEAYRTAFETFLTHYNGIKGPLSMGVILDPTYREVTGCLTYLNVLQLIQPDVEQAHTDNNYWR